MLTLIDCDFISINVLNMKLIFIACFASAIIAAQGFSSTELIKKFMDAVLERARLAMRPGTNGNILKVKENVQQSERRIKAGGYCGNFGYKTTVI